MIFCGEMTEKDRATAMELTEHDNEVIDQFRGDMDCTLAQVQLVVERTDFYEELDEAGITQAAERISIKFKLSIASIYNGLKYYYLSYLPLLDIWHQYGC